MSRRAASPTRGTFLLERAPALRAAAAVMAPSQFAADEIRTVLGVSDVHVIPHGLSELFRDPIPATTAALRGMGIPGPFVLHMRGATTQSALSALGLNRPGFCGGSVP